MIASTRALKKKLAKLYRSLVYHHFKIQKSTFEINRMHKTKQKVFVLKLNGIDRSCTVAARERLWILVTRTETR